MRHAHARPEKFMAPIAGLKTALLTTALTAVVGFAYAESHDPVTVSHGYSFFGDLKYPADFKHLDYVNPNAPKGGEISQWARGSFDNFNPYVRKGIPVALASSPYETFLSATADDPTASYCFLCETLEYPESKDWVIFNMRKDITFSDGRPMTAEDVKFSHTLFIEQGIPSFRAAFGGMIDAVEVLGPYKIKFTFAEDAPRRDVVELAGGIPVMSKAWFEETGTRLDDSSDVPFPGSGPYVLDSYDIGRRAIYKRNADYWGIDHPLNVGQNNFDRIRIEYFGDSTSAFEGFKAGVYTFRSENSSKQWATAYDFPGVQDGSVIKTELADGKLGQAQSFVFNLRREKFQDIRVRQALGLLFNFEWSNDQLFYGLYERVNSFWANSDLMAVGAPSAAEVAILQPLVDEGLLEPSILTADAVLPPVSGSRQLDRKNLRKAAVLLDEAGWIVNASGMREKDGEVLSIEILESSPAFDRIINPYVENMKALGIKAKLNRVDPAQEQERTRSYDFDMTTHSIRMTLEPSTGLQQYFGSEARNESSRNLMGLGTPAIDRLIEGVIDAETKEELDLSVRVLDRALRAEQFWVPQWFKNVYTVAYYDQYDHPEPLPPYALGELSFWWYNAEKGAALRAKGALK